MVVRKPPMSIDVGGNTYEINADYRVMIHFETMIQSKEVSEDQREFAEQIVAFDDKKTMEEACVLAKYHEAMEMFYKENIPENIEEAFEKMLWFYSCGKEVQEKTSKTNKRVYSYDHDMDYINAAFLQEYRIDLIDIEFYHWWKFVSLFTALRDDCKICEIIGWRSIDLKDLDKEQRKHAKKMKKLYALPDDIPDEDKELKKKITEALLNGGDVSEFI
jgi:hypothetical protein